MKAFELLEKYGWCQENLATDETGVGCSINDKTAANFCLIGAIYRKNRCSRTSLTEDLAKACRKLGFGSSASLSVWNDHPERTKEEVVALLKELDI
jgi:hypothetical protein